ncbi:MAG: hypothetical protein HYY40_10265 [Bacteroidetes bacterium]|nr:hypothetical protein [Bacteroidota bacterium]
MIGFTIDTDWAPEEVIADALLIFESAGIKATIFATHRSEVILNCNRDLFEIGIHPNFNKLLNGDFSNGRNPEEVIDLLLHIYPGAKGVRSHSMMQSSLLLKLFAEKGLVYDVNSFYPYNFTIHPYLCWTGLIRMPYTWEDDVHFVYGKSFNDQELIAEIINAEYAVLDFHPVHIFMNSHTPDFYSSIRPYLRDPGELKKRINRENTGTRDFLLALIGLIKKKKTGTFKLIESAGRWSKRLL